MRRMLTIFICFALLATLALPVHALSSASAEVHSTISADGECQVVITGTIHLEEAVEELHFPIPLDAYSVKLDGSRARTEKTESVQLVDLSKKVGNMRGDLPISITYCIDNVVVQNEVGTQVQIPMLSGFAYPLDDFAFSVTFPGEVTAKPAFSGGYQQAGIEKDLVYEVSGPKISGYSTKELMDNETLLFTVSVPETMFPRTNLHAPNYAVTYWGMGICFALALLYWLITMRNLPPRRIRTTVAPEGRTAGELGSLLHLQGADLTMMVFSWAQLGYVTIHMKNKRSVWIYKRMDMGNERSSFERRCFQNLFRKDSKVNTASQHYALLRQKLALSPADLQDCIRKGSGNSKLLRILSTLAAAFSCGCLGISLGNGAALQWFMTIALAIIGAIFGWMIQTWVYGLYSLHKKSTHRALILCGIWLLLGLLAGQFGMALLGCLSQLLAGVLCAFGGLRTENGKQAMAQVLGLHRHLRTVPKEELHRINEGNPDYFHSVAPYALALGVDQQLAAHMGAKPLPDPSYLTTGSQKQLTASQWSALLRQTVATMDEQYHKLNANRFVDAIRKLIK